MKLTTRARYGVRMLIDIATHPAPVPLALVAERQGISVQYLRQLALPLTQRGILSSAKGKNGGFLLSRPAQSITLQEVVLALEGDICMTESKPVQENPYDACLRVYLYQVVDQRVSSLLASMTLSDIAFGGKSSFQI